MYLGGTLVFLLCTIASASDNDFMSSLRHLIYGNDTSANLYSDNTQPGLLPSPEASQYPAPPTTFGAYPQFTVGISGGSGTACNLPQQIGTGPYRIPRWYFNPARMRCELFYWSGCCGNGNNFNTFQSCQQVCEGSNLVLNSPQTRQTESIQMPQVPQVQHQQPQFLNVQQSNQQPNEWLLTKQVPQNTQINVAVEMGVKTCCQRPNVQTYTYGGSNQQMRWYYESNTGSCQFYLFNGYGDKKNGFQSFEECQRTCQSTSQTGQGQQIQVNRNADNSYNGGPAPHIIIPDPPEPRDVILGLTTAAPQPFIRRDTQPPRVVTREPQVIPIVVTTTQRQDSIELLLPPLPQPQQTEYPTLILTTTRAPRTAVQIVEESPNPCAYGTSNSVIQCGPGTVLSQTCSGQQFCHVGATSQTTVCCNKPANVDRCQQPLNTGVGNSNLQRWYYNGLTQQCQQCTYKGLQGNENNFMNRQDCENSCIVNPCQRGVPFKSQGVTVQCSSNNQAVCPAGYYCHLGADSSTSVCCQALGGDPCGQPMNCGRGNAMLQRWYWDQSRQQCTQFTYKGLQGNQNNFLCKQDCEKTCYVFVNPCNQPIPLPPQMCSAQNPTTCQGNCWCHIGGSPSTTVCCPSEGNPCDLPLNRGTGGESLPRWFYNQLTGTCEQFSYCGLKGNQNNFLTREQCEGICAPNPCPEGRPFIGVDGRTQSCSASASLNTCPSTYWCHVGSDQSTTVCCPAASQNSCNLPMSTGEGNQQLERFYFDSSTKTCRPFTYNGLKGNQNNFLSLRSCQLACQPLDNPCIGQPATTPSGQVLFCSATNKDTCPVNFWCHLGATPETTVCCPGPTNACSVPLAPGTGDAGLARWYYNPDDRECVPFQYNGKRGNQNNFITQTECERTCPEQLCLLSIDRGACGGRQTRYAFNRQTSQCVPFEYTGCGGNLNNFQTMSDCMATCGNVGFR